MRSSQPFRPLALAVAALLLAPAALAAQSSLTPEIVDRGAVWAQLDVFGYAARRAAGGYETYEPRVTAGVGRGLELGLSAMVNLPADPTVPDLIVPGAKWRVLDVERLGLAAAVGGSVRLPTRGGRAAERPAMLFGSIERAFGGWAGGRLAGPTLGAGAYAIVGRDASATHRSGAILELDQPLGEALSLSAEWVSGVNLYGYLSAGVTATIGRTWLYAGYARGNDAYQNHGPYLSYGVEF